MPGTFDDIIEAANKPAEDKGEPKPEAKPDDQAAEKKQPSSVASKAVAKPPGQGMPVCDQFKQVYGERKKPS